jgi:hypothetical protein
MNPSDMRFEVVTFIKGSETYRAEKHTIGSFGSRRAGSRGAVVDVETTEEFVEIVIFSHPNFHRVLLAVMGRKRRQRIETRSNVNEMKTLPTAAEAATAAVVTQLL